MGQAFTMERRGLGGREHDKDGVRLYREYEVNLKCDIVVSNWEGEIRGFPGVERSGDDGPGDDIPIAQIVQRRLAHALALDAATVLDRHMERTFLHRESNAERRVSAGEEVLLEQKPVTVEAL